MLKWEEVNLKGFEIELGSKVEAPVVKNDHKTRGLKRKNFDELNSKQSKTARARNVVEILDSDRGLKEKILKVMKRTEKSEEDFDLSCLSLMKTMGISNMTILDTGYKTC